MDVLDRARGNIILFSLNPNNKKIVAHIRGGETAVTLDKRDVIIRNSELDEYSRANLHEFFFKNKR